MRHSLRAWLSDLLHRWSHKVEPHLLRINVDQESSEALKSWIDHPPKCGKCGRTLRPR